jgi:hypothetical protein
MHPAARSTRRFVGLGLALAALGACDRNPNELTLRPVTAGHIGGHAFTVTGGTVYQAVPDGPVYADASGGQLVFDDTPAGLGMTDPDLIHLRTRFAISEGGSLQISAFGDVASEFATGVWVLLSRVESEISYDFRLSGASFADSAFTPPPPEPGAEHWVATEFYADSVPGYGTGLSGITMWELNDLTAAPNQDVLRCDPGPATDPTPLAGERVGYALQRSWLLAVEVVDQIVGPCV